MKLLDLYYLLPSSYWTYIIYLQAVIPHGFRRGPPSRPRQAAICCYRVAYRSPPRLRGDQAHTAIPSSGDEKPCRGTPHKRDNRTQAEDKEHQNTSRGQGTPEHKHRRKTRRTTETARNTGGGARQEQENARREQGTAEHGRNAPGGRGKNQTID